MPPSGGLRGDGPPREYRWKKGQSGNPKGRPKKKTFGDWLNEVAQEVVKSGKGVGKCQEEIVARALLHKAKRGSISAMALFVERKDGKMKDFVELSRNTDFPEMSDEEIAAMLLRRKDSPAHNDDQRADQ